MIFKACMAILIVTAFARQQNHHQKMIENVVKRFCKNKSNGNYQHPYLNTKFVSCSNSIAYVMDCPAGLHFKTTTGRCEYPTHRKPNQENAPLVRTHCGTVEGKKQTIVTDKGNNKVIYEYRNIPYAVPPIGERRWRPPVPMSKEKSTCWDGTLKYNNESIKCMQKFRAVGDIIGQEDCLLLTVRTPTLKRYDSKTCNRSKPVLVWIHGGAMLWSNNDAPGYHPNSEFTASLDVVTVSVNYRLNAFGFLSLKELWINSGPDESYGNYGIMDMIQALKWIKENIRYFGGDPDRVTIYGQSGGGAGVHSLLASNPAKGLFQKAITISGPPNIRMDHHQANTKFRSFLSDTNCTQSTLSERRECLIQLDANTVTEYAPWFRPIPGFPPQLRLAHVALVSFKDLFPENRPSIKLPIEIIDPVVIQRSPDEITTSGNRVKVDVALGNLPQEIPLGGSDSNKFTDFESLRLHLEPRIASFNNASYDPIFALYNRTTPIRPKEITPQYVYTNMATDTRISCTINDLVDHFSALSDYNVYRFVISQPPSPVNGVEQRAYHGWATRALFGFKEFPGFKPSADEIKLMENLRKFYKDFLRGSSTFARKHQDKTTVFWKNRLRVFNHKYNEKECTFWKDYGFLRYSWGNTEF